MITAEILAFSKYKGCNPLVTFSLMYPRFIHSELLTHKMLGRNSSSSRAIPAQKMRDFVRGLKVSPSFWGKNKPGMSAEEQVDDPYAAKDWWDTVRDTLLDLHEEGEKLKIHKQILNRILEPVVHINTIVTATELENFFALRTDKAAQPEFQALATAMKNLYDDAVSGKRWTKFGPTRLSNRNEIEPTGELTWHIPFYAVTEDRYFSYSEQLNICAARCARISYQTYGENEIDPNKDLALSQKLIEGGHWSPFEHILTPAPGERWGQYFGWKPLRAFKDPNYEKYGKLGSCVCDDKISTTNQDPVIDGLTIDPNLAVNPVVNLQYREQLVEVQPLPAPPHRRIDGTLRERRNRIVANVTNEIRNTAIWAQVAEADPEDDGQ
jgi:hypothetical protein